MNPATNLGEELIVLMLAMVSFDLIAFYWYCILAWFRFGGSG